MIKKGLFEAKSRRNKDNTGEIDPDSQSRSETTIYQEAVPWEQSNKMEVDSEITFTLNNQKVNRDSTSAEEQMDTSDELVDLNVDKFIAECQEDARRRSHKRELLGTEERQDFRMGQSHEMIKEAEEGKARMLATPGTNLSEFKQQANIVDESYMVIGGHVDE